MKKKKLSKEQLIGWNDQVNVLFKNLSVTFKKSGKVVISFDSLEDAKRILQFAKLAHQQIKSLIESSAQKPSDIVRADVCKYILGVYDMLNVEGLTLHEIVDLLAERILKIRQKETQEPSKAELEEFKSEWRGKILHSVGSHAFSLPLSILDEMLKKYDKLRRG